MSSPSTPSHIPYRAFSLLASKPIFLLIAAILIIVLGVVGMRAILGGGGAQPEVPSETQSTESSIPVEDATAQPVEEETRPVAGAFDYDAFTSSPAEVTSFSLTDDSAPPLSDEDARTLLDDVGSIQNFGTAGFVFVDLQSGCGLSYNADAASYTASSFKMPYATYICQHLDAGDLTFQDLCTVTTSMDGTLVAGQSYSVSDLLQNMILISGNDSFVALRMSYDQLGIDSWLADQGVWDASAASTQYPVCSTRSLIKLWANTYDYFQSGTGASQWLMDLAANTNISFIREVLAGQGATVLNKAGWFATDDVYSRCVADAGIILDEDGNAYLMAILTNMSYDTCTASLFETLAADLYRLRDEPGVVDAQEEV